MRYEFERDKDSGVILVTVELDGLHSFKMLLDTGASTTTFDFNSLHLVGYAINHALDTNPVETANGIIKVNSFQALSISAFGHTVKNISMQIYDFIAHGIISDYDGVLGLDFFQNTVFTIDMVNNTIQLNSIP